MPRILHAADFHLDSPLSSLPPDKAALRRRDLFDALTRTVELANSLKSDLLLISGDLFDDRGVSLDTVRAAARALGQTSARVFIAPGNHDYISVHSPYRAVLWPDNVHVFALADIEAVRLDDLDTTVYGAAFTAPERTDCPLEGFDCTGTSGTRIMLLHGEADVPASRYGPVPSALIKASGLDYLALGHVHCFPGILSAGVTAYSWPGVPEGRGFDESGPKGVIVGAVGRGRARLEFLPLCSKRYEIIEVALEEGDDPLTRALKALPPDSQNVIGRMVFTGASPGALDLPALLEPLQSRFFHLSLRDQTELARDLWAQAGDDTLKGLFLKHLRLARETAAADEKLEIDLAARIGLAALENRPDPCEKEAAL